MSKNNERIDTRRISEFFSPIKNSAEPVEPSVKLTLEQLEQLLKLLGNKIETPEKKL